VTTTEKKVSFTSEVPEVEETVAPSVNAIAADVPETTIKAAGDTEITEITEAVPEVTEAT